MDDDEKLRRLRAAFRRAMERQPDAAARLATFLLLPFAAAAAAPGSEDTARVSCARHGTSSRAWTVCDHVIAGAAVGRFERFPTGEFAGSVLCSDCANAAGWRHGVLLCELCVLERWGN